MIQTFELKKNLRPFHFRFLHNQTQKLHSQQNSLLHLRRYTEIQPLESIGRPPLSAFSIEHHLQNRRGTPEKLPINIVFATLVTDPKLIGKLGRPEARIAPIDNSGFCTRQPRHPLLGMETTNLYVADLYFLGRIIQKFASVVKGVLVKEVFQDSPTESAGLKSNDVIVQFGGKKVQSFLELYESMWHKVGETVALTVVRLSDGFVDLKMVVDEVALDDLCSWQSFEGI